MTLTDEEFREAYKPLEIPANYEPADTRQNKILFALAMLGSGTTSDVIAELEKLEPGIVNDQLSAITKTVLTDLFDKGLLNGNDYHGTMHYNLSKITQANDGAVEPRFRGHGRD
jgi:isopentenyl diphosphate isomerase/L-lactate dehydrogenase-like FMN-dependent dehydrogenase